ncbi:hypothetical protein BKA83DRAFT_105029 [Pisolithus microcarpus]|nr:hypothetical protein BKA83DRAFT_105029 [Pisolithus microcarpus]
MPTRLLNTHTGVLCDRAAQRSQFMDSQQCKQLLLSATPSEPVIRTAVLQHFQFVMFSHRWGESEPVLRDIRDRLVYDMSPRGGVKKLQNFCRTALAQGYQWAWSDTCCIDKDSSAELQEAIVAMFGWYRRSALTIVYLADVRESGSFVESDWFRRGWTLQELLAPGRILFYTRSWTLYKNVESSNHKTDGAVLEELKRSAGIAPRFLTNFSPGIDDARSRLQWASSRRTSRGEDIAYSLFGIFNINNLHISYGESAEDALGRLLAEIISRSGDISILDWVGVPSPFHSCFPASITSYGTLPSSPFPPEEQSLTVAQQATPSKALRKFCGTLTKSSLPRFINRRLILPCLSYRVDAVRLKSADASSPSYTYEIQASGLKPRFRKS